MQTDYAAMTNTELVDLLSQYTMKVTQQLNERKFNDEYKENKNVIQQIILEIERRKQNSVPGTELNVGLPD